MDFAKLQRRKRIERMRREHVLRLESAGVELPNVLKGRELPASWAREVSSTMCDGLVRIHEIHTDFLFAEAKAVLDGETKTISGLQRELHIGHERAKQLIEDVTIGRYMVEVKVKGIGWSSAGVVLSTKWHHVAEAIALRCGVNGPPNTRKLWRAIQRSLGLNWQAPWEIKS